MRPRPFLLMPCVAALSVILAFAAARPLPLQAQSRCGLRAFDGVIERLQAIEAEQPTTTGDAQRRSRELAELFTDEGPLARIVSCPADSTEAQVQTLARYRILELWAKFLALGAIEYPVYPAPYRRGCAALDGTALQAQFVRVWYGRLDAADTETPRIALREALENDESYSHVADLAKRLAARLRIGALPLPGSDERAWLQASELARSRAAAALPANTNCGPIAGVWGLSNP